MKRLRSPGHLLPSFLARLSAAERQAVALLGELVARHGSPLYLVGGSVRDLLLGQTHLDLDFVVEADAPAVARAFQRASSAKIIVHREFCTATVISYFLRFDLITARREIYPRPGALPIVEPSTLTDDLARRDFTINAMALALTGPTAGRLIDPHDGRADLAHGLLRVLHDASFRDDPTRLWRAARYLARMRLTLEPRTAALLRRDLGYLDAVSPARIRGELERVLDERWPERAVAWLDQLGVLAATHPALAHPPVAAVFRRVRRLRPARLHDAYLCALITQGDAVTIEGLIRRIEPERQAREALRRLPELRVALHDLAAKDTTPSAVVRLLDHFPEAALVAWAACFPRRRGGRIARAYLTSWRHVRPLLDGHRLQELGVPHGPAIGEVLRALRTARLDGRVGTLDDEIGLVQTEFVQRPIDSSAPGRGTEAGG